MGRIRLFPLFPEYLVFRLLVKGKQDSGNEIDPGPEWYIFYILTSKSIDGIIRVVIKLKRLCNLAKAHVLIISFSQWHWFTSVELVSKLGSCKATVEC